VKHDRRWWEILSEKQREGKQGRLALVKGRNAGIACPKCGLAPVVYNGNYFCDNWGDECNWALPHPATSKSDREICDLIGTDYE
jgi:hypothetical protein